MCMFAKKKQIYFVNSKKDARIEKCKKTIHWHKNALTFIQKYITLQLPSSVLALPHMNFPFDTSTFPRHNRCGALCWPAAGVPRVHGDVHVLAARDLVLSHVATVPKCERKVWEISEKREILRCFHYLWIRSDSVLWSWFLRLRWNYTRELG